MEEALTPTPVSPDMHSFARMWASAAIGVGLAAVAVAAIALAMLLSR